MTQAFIERQFPVSKLSKESYKERKAGASQTLTGLGKWWGRKPLVLVRAAILGCLMPTSDNPRRDMEIFLKIMSMDESGLLARADRAELDKLVRDQCGYSAPEYRKLAADEKAKLRKQVFGKLGYDAKISLGLRPEQFTRPADDHAWNEINHHLGTQAFTLQDLVRQLSIKRFGKTAVIGDCFCGGGSVPFEAARLGLDVYASDLNPVAGVLTWASLNMIGADNDLLTTIGAFQERVYHMVDEAIAQYETNNRGWRADVYLYCNEAVCPECDFRVPLLPSLVVAKGSSVVLQLIEKPHTKSFDFKVIQDASKMEVAMAEKSATIKNYSLQCPKCKNSTPIPTIRKDRDDGKKRPYRYNTPNALRKWDADDVSGLTTDILTERLYCIRYVQAVVTNNAVKYVRHYVEPSHCDLQMEHNVMTALKSKMPDWHLDGTIPNGMIEPGWNTNQPVYERGWSYWHHLFNPRQLLIGGFFMEAVRKAHRSQIELVSGLLGINKLFYYNSKLCIWDNAGEKGQQTYYNQALNTPFNYVTRSMKQVHAPWFIDFHDSAASPQARSVVDLLDARDVNFKSEIWLTDPPYADAIHYHELSEFFLAWDKHLLQKAFPDWYTDSKRVLAVRGGEGFAQSMIDIYANLTAHMPDDGLQVVMFTHSDPAVWAQLALIMWKAGLKVTAAWNIATETDASGLKDGNYVKGTVLLVLRKRTGRSEAFLDEINADIKAEVVRQIESMQKLDTKEDPNFADPDYVLAAYAASLKVLTAYASIGELNLDQELDKAINDPKNSQVVALIERAKKQAYDCIIPADFDTYLWKELSPAERFYTKGLEYEKHGGYQISTYQEYARGFALSHYSRLMANERANTCRLKTPSEFAMQALTEVPRFEDSLLRLVLAAIHISLKEDEQPKKGLWHLKNNLLDYWAKRDMLKQLLTFLRDTRDIANMPHWQAAAQMAEHIYVLVDNDHI